MNLFHGITCACESNAVLNSSTHTANKVLVFGAAWHPSMVKRGGGTLGISHPSKRAKWKDMVSLKNVTDSALSAISKTLERQGTGENISRTMLSRMVHEEYQKFAWTISLPQEQGRDDFEWGVCRPDRLLQYFLDEAGGDFKNLLASTLDIWGAERLTLVFTADAVTPGDPLRPENFRKFWATYFHSRILVFTSTRMRCGCQWLYLETM